ncbi:hypothetical protein A2372_02880 [Candidatus Wolfebacteria bacterium RIFOXYB1_FULL_54_12]|uniref:Uncharacterized protein n=1 Tax=Candidatus Wolfebacteria bacterium RIFOXYB1_FULL_54_12 TaxID=1802559 RepID=A0A1F8DZX3_9BACT|nr:MAG: hypothetical protein A2372_02880 [Candidatus Wolfebacteria bacterium RIFOXYB1_FULL_54_12]
MSWVKNQLLYFLQQLNLEQLFPLRKQLWVTCSNLEQVARESNMQKMHIAFVIPVKTGIYLQK